MQTRWLQWVDCKNCLLIMFISPSYICVAQQDCGNGWGVGGNTEEHRQTKVAKVARLNVMLRNKAGTP